jgi:hypothetical protein
MKNNHLPVLPSPVISQVHMHTAQVYDLTRRLHIQETASAAFASNLGNSRLSSAQPPPAPSQYNRLQQQQQFASQTSHAVGRSGAAADSTSHELMTALGVAMPPPSPAALSSPGGRVGGRSRLGDSRRHAQSSVDLAPFGDSDSTIELAGAKAAAQRLQAELSATQQVRPGSGVAHTTHLAWLR